MNGSWNDPAITDHFEFAVTLILSVHVCKLVMAVEDLGSLTHHVLSVGLGTPLM